MSVEQLRRQLEALARLPEQATRDAAEHVCDIAAATGGSVTLGKRRRRYQLKARPQFYSGRAGEFRCTVWGTPTGPWVWRNTGTRPHAIPRRRRKKARFIHGAGYTHPVNAHNQIRHPGTAGAGRWRKVIAQARVDVPDVYRAAIGRAVTGRG